MQNGGQKIAALCREHMNLGFGYLHCLEQNIKSAVVCNYFIRALQLITNQSNDMNKSMSEAFRKLKVQGGYQNPAGFAGSFISSLILS